MKIARIIFIIVLIISNLSSTSAAYSDNEIEQARKKHLSVLVEIGKKNNVGNGEEDRWNQFDWIKERCILVSEFQTGIGYDLFGYGHTRVMLVNENSIAWLKQYYLSDTTHETIRYTQIMHMTEEELFDKFEIERIALFDDIRLKGFLRDLRNYLNSKEFLQYSTIVLR